MFGALTQKQAAYINPKTISLRSKLRMPLIFVTVGAGLLGSLSMSSIKGVTESFKADSFSGLGLYGYAVAGIVIAVL